MDRLSNILKQRLHEAQSAQAEHPSADTLLEFVERSLAAPQRENVLAHLAICPTCRDAVALAMPEVSESTKAAAAQSRGFYLPIGMRWASLAAALAVAAGVGLISYEHQSEQKLSAANPAALHNPIADKYQIPAKASNERSATPAMDAVTTSAKSVDQKKSPKPNQRPEEKSARKRALAKDQLAAAGGSAGAVLGGIVESQSPAAEPMAEKAESKVLQVPLREQSGTPFASSAGAFMASSVPAPPPESAATNAVTSPVIRGSTRDGVYAVSNSVPAPASEMVKVEAADASPQSNEAIGGPAKTLRSSAVSGPGFKARSAYRFNGIVHWAISQAGKLERNAQDGAATIIEPAAGVTFRALAAAGTGIEVWAGGLQPDLSAKQWRQQPVLFHSSDAGETWTKVNGPWHGAISQLRLADTGGSVIVMAEDGTWKTTDAGQNWQKQ